MFGLEMGVLVKAVVTLSKTLGQREPICGPHTAIEHQFREAELSSLQERNF